MTCSVCRPAEITDSVDQIEWKRQTETDSCRHSNERLLGLVNQCHKKSFRPLACHCCLGIFAPRCELLLVSAQDHGSHELFLPVRGVRPSHVSTPCDQPTFVLNAPWKKSRAIGTSSYQGLSDMQLGFHNLFFTSLLNPIPAASCEFGVDYITRCTPRS